MARPTAWKDDYTLLCERCGYVVEGLDVEGACPECGKPIAESLPERRVGTPWQQKPGVGSLVRTWWMTVRHPARTLDMMRVDERDRGMVPKTLLLGSCSTFVLVLILEVLNPYSMLGLIITGIAGLVSALVVLVIFAILTEIEMAGLRLIGRTRSIRISEPIARGIVSHGSVGWVWCGFFVALSLYCFGQSWSPKSGDTMYPVPPWSTDNFISGYGLQDRYSSLALWFFLLSLPGFLFFETFAWLGLRRCKYANRARAGGVEGGESPAAAS